MTSCIGTVFVHELVSSIQLRKSPHLPLRFRHLPTPGIDPPVLTFPAFAKRLVRRLRCPVIQRQIPDAIAHIMNQLGPYICWILPEKSHPIAAVSISLFERLLHTGPDAEFPDDHESHRALQPTCFRLWYRFSS